ncbi:MAG: tetratricopeptide repeat protein [Flavobacteriaceae bacterium]|nr:tetratricopeptide repeat protein [Flavobacteriaceae bacterium]
MKIKLAITLFFIAMLQYSYGQEFEIVRETKKLIDSRNIYLNGGMRAEFGGKSRTSIKFDLPPNTVEWYYSFTTTKGESGNGNLNLAIQLSRMLLDPSGLTSIATSRVKIPEGVAAADIFLLDQRNMNLFLQKVDLNGGTFLQYPEGLVENTKQAIVKVDDIKSGTWYLGIKNPSSVDGINISIEIVAVTETRKRVAKTEEQEKAELYGNLGWTNFENGDYAQCVEYCDKAVAEYELGWVLANKGLAQLMLDKETEGTETYINAITLVKKQPNPNRVFKEIIKNIDNALKIKPELKGAQEIKSLIQAQ